MNMAGYCIICGAPLINSTDGIGCGCREMMRKCTYLHMKNNEDKTFLYSYYNVEKDIYMKLFIRWADGKKFRSNFKKNFIPSVISFYTEKGFVSKKQFDIVKNMIDDVYSNDYLLEKAKEDIDKKKHDILVEYRKENYQEIVEMTHKMWASSK